VGSSPSLGVKAPPLAKAGLPPLVLFNDTLAFPYRGGGSAGSASFQVPKGYANLTVDVTGTTQCPGYIKDAAVEAKGSGALVSVAVLARTLLDQLPVGDVQGYRPIPCALVSYANGQTSVEATATGEAGGVSPSAWTLSAVGEFTGTARVVVTASP
jgi:hypothetical protein